MPRLPIHHALSLQRASTDDIFAKRSVEKGLCRFHGAVTKQRHEFTPNTSADYVISLLTCVFNTYGIPEEIKTDYEPPFNGSNFANFAQEQGSDTERPSLGGLKLIGDVERFTQTLKKSARTSKLE